MGSRQHCFNYTWDTDFPLLRIENSIKRQSGVVI